jgi:REP element-mobilizing transposase RayT
MKQLAMKLPTWGGRRRGAGRKPKGETALVTHGARERLKRLPVHVNWRMRYGTWNLRSKRCFRRIKEALWAACDRFGVRITHFSVLGNHIHLIVEADSKEALSRAMQGLGVRIAKKLNRVMGRRGAVLADRYFSRALRTPSEVKSAVHYVVRNFQNHFDSAEIGPDPYSSEGCAEAPVVVWVTLLMTKALGPAPE